MRSALGRVLVVLAVLALLATGASAVAQPAPRYEIAVSPVAVEPPAPAPGQRATLVVVIRSRALTPVSRPEAVSLRVVFTRAGPAGAEAEIGEQLGSLPIGEEARVAVPWTAEPGTHALGARVELLPGAIAAGDVLVTLAPVPAVPLAVPGGDRAGAPAAPGIVLRPPGAAEPPRTMREPATDESQPRDRRIATAPLGLVGARAATQPGGGLVLDVPVAVANAGGVRAVEVRCTVFAQAFGDLVGTGRVTRPVTDGALAELVAVPIAPRPGRSLARAARYSCLATYATGDAAAEPRAPLPGGIAATPDRRQVYERVLDTPLATFSDLAEGTIEPR